jgi:prepilin signal peptidase PulO-like enzyme (type II secretory pathway)
MVLFSATDCTKVKKKIPRRLTVAWMRTATDIPTVIVRIFQSQFQLHFTGCVITTRFTPTSEISVHVPVHVRYTLYDEQVGRRTLGLTGVSAISKPLFVFPNTGRCPKILPG